MTARPPRPARALQPPRRARAVRGMLALAALLLLATALAGCSTDTGTRPAGSPAASRTAEDSPAPTPDQIVRDAVGAALTQSTAHFTFSASSREKGYRSTATGSGDVDLARGRLDQVQKVRTTDAGWQSRYLLVGERAYVKNLSGPKAGSWYQGAVDQPGKTYTRDGFSDPMEYLRVLLTLDPGVSVVGDRVLDDEGVVAYAGTARPSRTIKAGYRRPGRNPGQLAGNLRYLKISQVAVRVYLDGKGLPMRIVLSGTGPATGGVRPKVSATLTTVGWGTPRPIRRPPFAVPSFDQLYS